MKCFRLFFDHLAWIKHQFLSDIRDSRKAGSLWGMMRGVGGIRKSIDKSWLAKGLGLGLLCWGFEGVQEEIPSEEASTLQIGSVAFPPDNAPFHNSFLVTDYLTKMSIKTVPHPPYSPDPCSRSCWNGTTNALQPEEITWKGPRFSCGYHQQKYPFEKNCLET